MTNSPDPGQLSGAKLDDATRPRMGLDGHLHASPRPFASETTDNLMRKLDHYKGDYYPAVIETIRNELSIRKAISARKAEEEQEAEELRATKP